MSSYKHHSKQQRQHHHHHRGTLHAPHLAPQKPLQLLQEYQAQRQTCQFSLPLGFQRQKSHPKRQRQQQKQHR